MSNVLVRKEMGSTGLLGEYQKVFSWSYEDLRGFDPGLVQHIIKLARKKQELVNSALKAPFRRGLRDFLRAGMFFLVHPEQFQIGYLLQRSQIILEPAFIFTPSVKLL
jgi:hypothetical protein